MKSKPHRLGIDLGGTKIEAILLNPDGPVLYRKRLPTPRHADSQTEYNGIVETVIAMIEDAMAHRPVSATDTIGVGIPGTINARNGLVQNANTTSLIGKPFQKDLEQRLGRPIGMENDANCFTIAEALQGAGQGY